MSILGVSDESSSFPGTPEICPQTIIDVSASGPIAEMTVFIKIFFLSGLIYFPVTGAFVYNRGRREVV